MCVRPAVGVRVARGQLALEPLAFVGCSDLGGVYRAVTTWLFPRSATKTARQLLPVSVITNGWVA